MGFTEPGDSFTHLGSRFARQYDNSLARAKADFIECISMMEQSRALLHKDHAQLLGRGLDGLVHLTAEGCGEVLDTGPLRAVHVVGEGEL